MRFLLQGVQHTEFLITRSEPIKVNMFSEKERKEFFFLLGWWWHLLVEGEVKRRREASEESTR